MPEEEEDVELRQLQEALDSGPENPSRHFEIGILLWKRGEEGNTKELKERAAGHFVVAARLNPSNGAAFRYLGHYYSRVTLDQQRASKCYQRAVTLNPDDFESGEGLCDLLDGAGKESLEIAVSREASERSPRAFWAFRRLGYLQVYQKKWSEAVHNLQQAIRGYPTCADLWEALGLAYQRLGMFTAAVKSYGRAVELEDSKVFALIESGNILLMLGSFRKGVEQFRHALEITPHNVAGHFGLASALLGLSKECINSGAFSWAASLLEEASEVAKASTRIEGNISSIWKLRGDIQITYAICFPWVEERTSTEIDEESFKTSIYQWKKTRLLAAFSSNRSYQRALHLNPWKANIYTDVAMSSDLIISLEEGETSDKLIWQLPEKMSLGSLMLEGENIEFWVALGCLSHNNALKQHAFIRGLQLDISLSFAWACLGKLYRDLGDERLAKQAFDRARSIDPSLALSWAGMAIDASSGESLPEEAYESCLRAVQTLPLAEFQVGLGKLAALSGQLLSPQVFGAVKQAVQRAPFYHETHNLNGLVCEARGDHHSAIAAYHLARYALNSFSKSAPKSHYTDISFNLARSSCQAGHAIDAAQECEELREKGLLDNTGLQIYAIALWQLGKNDLAIREAMCLAERVSTMDSASGPAAISLICQLVYCISGPDFAAETIFNLPRELLWSPKLSFVITALSTIDSSNQLQSLLPGCFQKLASHEEVTEMHSLTAIGKMLTDLSTPHMGIQRAVHHLRRALHMYPGSSLIRNQLSSLLLSSQDWMASHTAIRCIVAHTGHSVMKDVKSPFEILGSAAVACYASCTRKLMFSFPTCRDQLTSEVHGPRQSQKWLHQEPWNHKAYYLLVLNILQKAREERFPQHVCVTLKRLVVVALSKEIYLKGLLYQYQRFQLLLCASELCLHFRDYLGCISWANTASELLLPSNVRFFAHLQLSRAYAALEDWQNLRNEYMKCLQFETDYEIGWVSLKYLESKYKLHHTISPIDVKFAACLKEKSENMWIAVFDLVCCQSFVWDQDFLHAEQALQHALSVGNADSCVLLCHGAICMELARQSAGSQYLSLAISSLTKAQKKSPVSLPIAWELLAQAVASLGSRDKWEQNLRSEWFSWPAEMRPAELFFQMHLLARHTSAGSNRHPRIESSQTPVRWILRGIHLNPSCSRYWKILQKLTEM